jgi:hypothetical protein
MLGFTDLCRRAAPIPVLWTISVFILCAGCSNNETALRALYERQDHLETEVARLTKEIAAQDREQDVESPDTVSLAQIEARLLTANEVYRLRHTLGGIFRDGRVYTPILNPPEYSDDITKSSVAEANESLGTSLTEAQYARGSLFVIPSAANYFDLRLKATFSSTISQDIIDKISYDLVENVITVTLGEKAIKAFEYHPDYLDMIGGLIHQACQNDGGRLFSTAGSGYPGVAVDSAQDVDKIKLKGLSSVWTDASRGKSPN